MIKHFQTRLYKLFSPGTSRSATTTPNRILAGLSRLIQLYTRFPFAIFVLDPRAISLTVATWFPPCCCPKTPVEFIIAATMCTGHLDTSTVDFMSTSHFSLGHILGAHLVSIVLGLCIAISPLPMTSSATAAVVAWNLGSSIPFIHRRASCHSLGCNIGQSRSSGLLLPVSGFVTCFPLGYQLAPRPMLRTIPISLRGLSRKSCSAR